MKSENVSEINVDVNRNDAVADTATGIQSVAGTEDAAGIEAGAGADVAAAEVATAADPGAAVRILKTASCQSLSGKSQLTYCIGANTAGEIGFCIVANSGDGLFNREWVPAASIKALTDTIPHTALKGLPIGYSSCFIPCLIWPRSGRFLALKKI